MIEKWSETDAAELCVKHESLSENAITFLLMDPFAKVLDLSRPELSEKM